MSVYDLNMEQMEQLKIEYYDKCLYAVEHRSISYGEMIGIDELVSDETIYDEYEDVEFAEDDFWCSASA